MSKLGGDLIMQGNETVQTQEELSAVVFEQSKTIKQLQEVVQKLEVTVFANAPGKAKKLIRIIELAELNREVSVSMVKSQFKIRSSDYARRLLREAVETSDLTFFKGQPGQESFVTKFKVENKAMHAYAEVYTYLQSEPIGTTITESAIAHRHKLNGQELMSTIGHLARHNELCIVLPMNRKGIRRVRRVR